MTEEAEHPTLTKEQIRFWIEKFKDGDITDIRYKQRMIDTFVNSVYLYDDKLVITYNVKDGARTVTLDEVNNSDLVQDGPPDKRLEIVGFQAFLHIIVQHFLQHFCFLPRK